MVEERNGEVILDVQDLKTYYYTPKKTIAAVDGVSFQLKKGEVLGIVGESGCGKSTVARAIVGLYNRNNTYIPSGSAMFEGKDLTKLSHSQMRSIRGKHISMIFQNPFISLNPVYTIQSQICEILRTQMGMDKKQAKERALELLKLVGIPSPEERLKCYPHQLSGGMQQRVMIAIALACEPDILLADEPTTALDVTVQAQVLDLMEAIRKKRGMNVILISHNMGVIAEMCDRILVMYAGVIVEEGDCKEIFESPMHPYTKGLLGAIPSMTEEKEVLDTIPGIVPVFTPPVRECRFAGRCPYALEHCMAEEPPMMETSVDRKVRCWLYEGKGGTSE